MLEPRAPRSPCPQAGPFQIGQTKPYDVRCGENIPGNNFKELIASGLLGCVQICTSYGTSQCVAVSFNAPGGVCYLKPPSTFSQATLAKDPTLDSAILLPGDVLNNCESLLNTGTPGQVFWKKYCGMDFNGNDLKQFHAKSLQDCINRCSSYTGCKAVSFEAAMTHGMGYFNCYLKNSNNTGNLVKRSFDVDSAVPGVQPVPYVPPAVTPSPAVVYSTSVVVVYSNAPVAPVTPVYTPPAVVPSASISASFVGDGSSSVPVAATSQGSVPTVFVTMSPTVSIASPPSTTLDRSSAATPAPGNSGTSPSISRIWVSGLVLAMIFHMVLAAYA